MATIRKKGKNSYQFRVSLGLGSDNKYKATYKTYKVTEKMTPKQLEKHLEYEAHKFEQSVLASSYIEPNNMLFKDFSKEWQTKWLEQEVSESTIMLRLQSLKNHIIPIIGHVSMHKITSLMLLDLMENLTRKDGREGNLSISSKQEIHKALVSIFKRAIDWNIISSDPMSGIGMPTEKRGHSKQINFYDKEEVKDLLEALGHEAYHWCIFIKLAISTGMRRSELIGLEWEHIDLENGLVDVRQAIYKIRGGSYKIGEPKYGSKRQISLPSFIVEDFKQYKLHCHRERMQLQHQWKNNNHDWVFYNEFGEFLKPDTATQWWSRFLKRTGFRKVRLHDLRHTSATLLVAQNVHAKIISERLGHRKIATTMDIYGHALPSADKEAGEKLNNVLDFK